MLVRLPQSPLRTENVSSFGRIAALSLSKPGLENEASSINREARPDRVCGRALLRRTLPFSPRGLKRRWRASKFCPKGKWLGRLTEQSFKAQKGIDPVLHDLPTDIRILKLKTDFRAILPAGRRCNLYRCFIG